MDTHIRIAVVEDNAVQRTMLSHLLDTEYAVSSFASGEEFLASPEHFDAVLLDIEMTGIDGYETCRRWRKLALGAAAPVIFVSAHDTAPERVAGYEAGGDDFITKPVAANELRHKLHAILEQRKQLASLANQSSYAQKVAFTAMASMGDLGVIIDFLRKSGQATSVNAVAARLIAAMNAWGLHGAVQVRSTDETINLTAEGPMTTMQRSVLDSLRDMGRIFEMGSRAVINYEHVTLLVENLPVDDPEKVGQLRDHLAALAESADMRLTALAAPARPSATPAPGSTINPLLKLTHQVQANRHKGQTQLLESLDHLWRTLGTLGLTELQSSYVDDMVKGLHDEALHYFDEAAQLESELAEAINRLG